MAVRFTTIKINGPDYSRLKATLANSKFQQENNAAYQTVFNLIEGLQRFDKDVRNAIAAVNNLDVDITLIGTTVLLRGTRANQPSFADVPVGSLYYVTDEATTEQTDGSAWITYADSGGVALDNSLLFSMMLMGG